MSDLILWADGNGFRPGRRYFILKGDNQTFHQVPVVCEADFIEWQRQTYLRRHDR